VGRYRLASDLSIAYAHGTNSVMQSLEFTHALAEIADALHLKELLATVDPWLQSANAPLTADQKKNFTQLLIRSNAAYQFLLKKETTRAVMDKIPIGKFLEESSVTNLITIIQPIPNTQHIKNNLNLYREFYPFTELIRWFLTMQSASRELLEAPKIGDIPEDKGLVEVELMQETGEAGFSAERIQILVSVLVEIHAILATVYGAKDDKLTFRYFDSGSGLAAGATCAATVADAMNKFLTFALSLMFWKQERYDRNLLSFSNALDVAKKIDQSVADGVVAPDDGARYKASLFDLAQRATGIGARVPVRVTAHLQRHTLPGGPSRNLLEGGGKNGD
jgi:hypothetical protein